jgi:hypothetical protein
LAAEAGLAATQETRKRLILSSAFGFASRSFKR